jgi:hypothetical protein
MVDILGTQVFDAQSSVVASAHEHGLVLFHTGNGQLFSANRTGARIWQCIERHLSADAIASEIGRHYAITPDVADAHTKRFLTDLVQRELVTLGTGP